MASQTLARSLLRCASATKARYLVATPQAILTRAQLQLRANPVSQRHLHTAQATLQDRPTTSAPAEAITTPPAQPLPDTVDPEPARNAAFLGEADSDDGFEAAKVIDGDLQPALDPTNSAFHGEADSDDGFEAQKIVDGENLEAVDATNSAYLGEADSDDGFEAHREAHPEEGDHKLVDPVETGLHGQPGELDR